MLLTEDMDLHTECWDEGLVLCSVVALLLVLMGHVHYWLSSLLFSAGVVGVAAKSADVVFLCAAMFIIIAWGRASRLLFSHFGPSILLIALTLLVPLFSLFHLINVPVFGWDVLWFWADDAVRVIESLHSNYFGHYGFAFPNHPATVKLTLSAEAVSGLATGIVALLAVVNFSVLVMLLVARSEKPPLFSVVVLSAVWSTPLLDNHVAIPGYADIWQGMGVALTVCSCLIVKDSPAPATLLLLTGVLYLALTKSTGFGLIASLLPAIVFALLNSRYHSLALKYGLVCVVISFSILTLIFAGPIHVGMYKYGLDITTMTISLGIHTWPVAFNDLSSALYNLYHAILLNGSFGLSFIALLIVAAYTCDRRSARSTELLLSLAGLFLYMLAIQIFSDYVVKSSTPSNDTSLSRFTLWLPFVTAVIIAETNFGEGICRSRFLRTPPPDIKNPLLRN